MNDTRTLHAGEAFICPAFVSRRWGVGAQDTSNEMLSDASNMNMVGSERFDRRKARLPRPCANRFKQLADENAMLKTQLVKKTKTLKRFRKKLRRKMLKQHAAARERTNDAVDQAPLPDNDGVSTEFSASPLPPFESSPEPQAPSEEESLRSLESLEESLESLEYDESLDDYLEQFVGW